MSLATVTGPHECQSRGVYFAVVDSQGARVAEVYAVSHGVDVTEGQALQLARRRALHLSQLVAREPTL